MESFRISSGKLGSSRRVVILRASVAHLPSQLAAFRHHKLPAKNPLSKPSLGSTPIYILHFMLRLAQEQYGPLFV